MGLIWIAIGLLLLLSFLAFVFRHPTGDRYPYLSDMSQGCLILAVALLAYVVHGGA